MEATTEDLLEKQDYIDYVDKLNQNWLEYKIANIPPDVEL